MPVEHTVVERVKVPEALLVVCSIPDMSNVQTNADLERVALESLAAAKCGNDDKLAIQEWQESTE